MRGGDGFQDAIGRDVPPFEITRWTDGHGWHDGEPSLETFQEHTGNPDFQYTVRFPQTDENPAEAFYNMAGGYESWDDIYLAIVDMYIDYIIGGGE